MKENRTVRRSRGQGKKTKTGVAAISKRRQGKHGPLVETQYAGLEGTVCERSNEKEQRQK